MKKTIEKSYNKHLWSIPAFIVGLFLILSRLIAFLFVCSVFYPFSYLTGEKRVVKKWIKRRYDLFKMKVKHG